MIRRLIFSTAFVAGLMVAPGVGAAHHNTVSCQSPGVWLIINSEADKAETFSTDQGHSGSIAAGGSTTVTYSGTSLTVYGTWSNGVENTNTGTGDCIVTTTTEATTSTLATTSTSSSVLNTSTTSPIISPPTTVATSVSSPTTSATSVPSTTLPPTSSVSPTTLPLIPLATGCQDRPTTPYNDCQPTTTTPSSGGCYPTFSTPLPDPTGGSPVTPCGMPLLPATGPNTWLLIGIAWTTLSIGVALIFCAACKRRDVL